MTDLHCPAIVMLVTSEAELAGEQLAGIFATPIAGSARAATLTEVIDAASLRAAIDHLADLHRGETIAIVATNDELRALVGRTAPITVEIGASGWAVRRR